MRGGPGACIADEITFMKRRLLPLLSLALTTGIFAGSQTGLPASPAWTQFETKLTLPAGCRCLKLNRLINKPGKLCVDDVTPNVATPP